MQSSIFYQEASDQSVYLHYESYVLANLANYYAI